MKKKPSFEKRQKERKRQQKKQDKERKRMERKASGDATDESGGDPDLAEAMALAKAAAEGKLDEFGNVIDPDAEDEEETEDAAEGERASDHAGL